LLDIDTKYYAAARDVLSGQFLPSARTINGLHYLPGAGSVSARKSLQ
jgi:hypothetical protein